MVERALRPANAAKIEAQNRKAALGKGVIKVINDLVIHRPAKLRVRMQNDRDGRAALFGRVEPSFETTGGSVENHLGHIFYLTELEDAPSSIGKAPKAKIIRFFA
jgi:hypothetical protein